MVDKGKFENRIYVSCKWLPNVVWHCPVDRECIKPRGAVRDSQCAHSRWFGLESPTLFGVTSYSIDTTIIDFRGKGAITVQTDKVKPKKTNSKKVTGQLSKGELHRKIASKTGLTKKQVGDVFREFEQVLADQMSVKGCGEMTLPGLAKFTTATRPAVRARKGVNPFTGEETLFAARPETRTVKIRALKKLKSFSNS